MRDYEKKLAKKEVIQKILTAKLEEYTGFQNLLKGTKGTISLAQAKDAVPGPNCMLKSLWG